jgi:hypothetical protein
MTPSGDILITPQALRNMGCEEVEVDKVFILCYPSASCYYIIDRGSYWSIGEADQEGHVVTHIGECAAYVDNDIISEELIRWMTEGTSPHMSPRSDCG